MRKSVASAAEPGIEPALMLATVRVISDGGLRCDAATAVAASVWRQLARLSAAASTRQVLRFVDRLGTRALRAALGAEPEGVARVVLARWIAEVDDGR